MKLAGNDPPQRYNRFGRSQRRRPLWRILLAPVALLLLAAVACFYGLRVLDADLPAAQVATASPAGSAPAGPVERTAKLPPLSLPADDAPHGSAMEWWYYSGLLDGPGGQRWAFHVAVFVANSMIKHTVMHAALTDLATGRRYTAQSRTGGIPAQASAHGFEFQGTGWTLGGAGPAHHLRFDDIGGAALTLDLQDASPVVAHHASGSLTPGLLDFGDSGISYYYSRPRMSARGSVGSGSATQPVSGEVWFDHQWGEFDVGRLGWSWFALHLADGSDLMVYQLFDRQGLPVATTGTVVRPNGAARALAANEISLQPARRWVSPRSRIDYVVGWNLKVPWGELAIDALHDDSEFDAAASSANIYWEGPVRVGGAQAGDGFLELSGYEALKAAQR